MDEERVVEVYTDGACSGNPGPGGWGALLRFGPYERELCGGEAGTTTNNRMELMAPIKAFEALTRPSVVKVYTDSSYVKNGVTSWMARWKTNGWLTGSKEPVKNVDLWQRLDEVVAGHEVEWFWVKGHAGHVENERADRLAAKGLMDVAGVDIDAESFGPKRGARGFTKPEGVAAGPCAATTKKGRPCGVGAGPSGFCHVHDPALQCGFVKADGKRCAMATGGGRCEYHQG